MRYALVDQNDAILRYQEFDDKPDDPVGKGWVWREAPMEQHVDTPEVIKARLIMLVQRHLDEAAQAMHYDDIKSAVTYADEPSVAKFQNEGRAFRVWRSLVWAYCYDVMAEVEAGTRAIPSSEELIAELPALVMP